MRSTTFVHTVLASTTLLGASTAAQNQTTYKLTDDLSYKNFFSAFDFYSGADPTHGFVQYQNSTSAIDQNLVGLFEDTQSVYLGVDHTSKDPKGRASVRLESKKTWNKGLLIADIYHMPHSECGIWPAYWLLSGTKEWPLGGEIDIVEGVNEQDTNAVTLHTSKGCAVDNTTTPSTGGSTHPAGLFSGTMTTDNCDVEALGQGKNVGCSIGAPKTAAMGSDTTNPLPSFGTNFNDADGGVYAMEWTSSSISVWFIPRGSQLYTKQFAASNGTDSTAPDPSAWGAPMARFAGKGCDFEERFKDLKIVFNIDFCGDWAGKEWDKKCRAKTKVDTCDEYVRDKPEAFVEAYWEIGALKWYQQV